MECLVGDELRLDLDVRVGGHEVIGHRGDFIVAVAGLLHEQGVQRDRPARRILAARAAR